MRATGTWRERLRARLERIRATAADLPDDELVTYAAQAQDDARFYRELFGVLSTEVARRADERGATTLISASHVVEVEWDAPYIWDAEMLEDNLRPNLPAEMWATVYSLEPPPPPPPPKPKIHTVRLLALGKRLGIDLEPFYRRPRVGPPKVKFQPRQEDKPL